MITTIIPTYKRPHLLKRAISSALKQTYSHLQVKVYDNASGDETEAVVREFMQKDSRVSYHCHAQNIGLVGNYQLSMAEVETPYFSFLSDDDVLLPWFYEEVMKGFAQHPGCVFSAGSTLIVSENGELLSIPLHQWQKEGYVQSVEACLEMITKYPVPTGVLFQRRLSETLVIDKENPLAWDCDFLLQAASRYPIFISKRPCGLFLHHEASYSNVQGPKQWREALHRMMKKVKENSLLKEEDKQTLIHLIHQNVKFTYKGFTRRALFAKRFEEALKFTYELKEEYGWNLETRILSVVVPLCRWVPFAFFALLLARKVKKLRQAKAYRTYEQYTKYLDIV